MKKLFLHTFFVQSCSNNSVSVHNEKWTCSQEHSISKCLIKFDIKHSKEYFPIDAEIRIRAHRISGDSAGGDAYRNNIVANKKIQLQIPANETVHFSEFLTVKGRVTSIVVSAWASQ